MVRESSFRGQVWQNNQNDQKLITAPAKSDVDVGDTVRVVSLGKFHDAMSPEGQPGHYVHAELRGLLHFLHQADDDIPEEDVEDLSEEYDFFKKWESVGEQISELMDIIDSYYTVMPQNDKERDLMDKGLLEHELKDVVESIRTIDEDINSDRESIKEEYGVESIEFAERSNYNELTLEDGETVKVPAFRDTSPNENETVVKQIGDSDYDAPEELIEFMKEYRKQDIFKRRRCRNAVEAKGFSFNLEAKNHSVLIVKVSSGNYYAEIPYFRPSMDQVEIQEAE
jgi:hypothetical protein